MKALLEKDCDVCTEGGYGDSAIYEEPAFSYNPIPGAIRNGALSGYFQSEKYFQEFETEIRSLFRHLTARKKKNVAGVHLRLGDYLETPELYHTLDASFLQTALSRLSKKIRQLVIFSDSPDQAMELVRQVPAAKNFELVVDRHDTLGALRELTAMQELVLSCSSFSWWGAYLGNQKKVFIQKKWFSGTIIDDQDIYRKNWIKL